MSASLPRPRDVSRAFGPGQATWSGRNFGRAGVFTREWARLVPVPGALLAGQQNFSVLALLFFTMQKHIFQFVVHHRANS